MFSFRIIKKDKNTWARVGLIKTPHGFIHTPAFFPVATNATIKTLDPSDLNHLGIETVLTNTYHLHIEPGEDIIKKMGGLHKFMNWPHPVVTDSGGFQVFSLGFGSDQKIGKIAKLFSPINNKQTDSQPKYLKITEEGVNFSSPSSGGKIKLTPENSIKIQEKLGADIIFSFDECTSPLADYDYTQQSMQRTHRWAKRCLKSKRGKDQALFGIIQGGRWKDLRMESTKFIESQPFDGIGIGGFLGNSKKDMFDNLKLVVSKLKIPRPRHLLGIGWQKDIIKSVACGIDTFDCVEPTRLARHGIFLTSRGRLNIKLAKYKSDKKPINKQCSCYTCRNFSRSYLHHLFKAKEILGLRLATIHNLYFMENLMKEIRQSILNNKFDKLVERWQRNQAR